MSLVEKAESIEQIPNYDEFVKKSGANLFYEKHWMKFFERNEENAFYLYTKENGKLRSFLSLTKEKDGTYYSLPFWFSEQVFIEEDLDSFIEKFDKLEGKEVVFWDISEKQAKRLEKNGFISFPASVSPELHIESIEDFWNSLGKKQRKNFKRAKRIAEEKGLEIVHVSNKEDLEQYFMLEQATVQRHGQDPEPFEYWEDILSTSRKESVLFLLVKKQGNPIAGGVSFLGTDKVYEFREVSLKKFQEYRPTELLNLYIIEEAIRGGIKHFDHGSNDISDFSTYSFKRKFSNKDNVRWEAVYPLTEKSRKESLKNAEEQKEKLRSFLSETRNNGT